MSVRRHRRSAFEIAQDKAILLATAKDKAKRGEKLTAAEAKALHEYAKMELEAIADERINSPETQGLFRQFRELADRMAALRSRIAARKRVSA